MRLKWLSILLTAAVLLAACAQAPTASAPRRTVPPVEALNTPTTRPERPTVTPSPTAGPRSAADAFAFEQNRRLGRGINLGNALEAPTEGEWGMVIEAAFFDQIKAVGFDSVRLPVNWSAHAAAGAPYTIDPAFMERVDAVVEQALARDLAVVLNIHHYDEAIHEEPSQHTGRVMAIWKQLAAHYQEAPDGLYFELLNEPHGTFANTGAWNKLAADLIAMIRQTNPQRTIVVGPGNWNSLYELYNLQLPEDERNLIVTVHYYLPFEFTHQGAEWVEDSDPWLGRTWSATKIETEAVAADLNQALKWARATGRPIFLGEFGAYSKADAESRRLWTDFVARAAEERGFSWAYWEFGAGFGAYDREAGEWRAEILGALIP